MNETDIGSAALGIGTEIPVNDGSSGEPDNRVKNEDRALFEAEAVDEDLDDYKHHSPSTKLGQRLIEDRAASVGYWAGRKYEIQAFDEKHQFENPINQELLADNIEALLAFGKNIIENQRKHGETLTTNQEMFEALAQFAEKHKEAIGGRLESKDGHGYQVIAARDSLVLERTPWHHGVHRGIDVGNPKETWRVSPYNEAGREPLFARRLHASDGARYSYEETKLLGEKGFQDDEEFDTGRMKIEKDRLGVTPEELENFRKFLSDIEFGTSDKNTSYMPDADEMGYS